MIIISYLVSYLIIYVVPRHRSPIEPFFIVVAAITERCIKKVTLSSAVSAPLQRRIESSGVCVGDDRSPDGVPGADPRDQDKSRSAQLNMLEMLPCGFDWIEVWGIGRQMLDAYTTANGTCQELLHCRSAMDRRPVPDHQKAGSDVSNQVLEKLDDVQAIERLLTHENRDSTGRSNAPHDREMIAGLPHAQDGRVSLGGVRLEMRPGRR